MVLLVVESATCGSTPASRSWMIMSGSWPSGPWPGGLSAPSPTPPIPSSSGSATPGRLLRPVGACPRGGRRQASHPWAGRRPGPPHPPLRPRHPASPPHPLSTPGAARRIRIPRTGAAGRAPASATPNGRSTLPDPGLPSLREPHSTGRVGALRSRLAGVGVGSQARHMRGPALTTQVLTGLLLLVLPVAYNGLTPCSPAASTTPTSSASQPARSWTGSPLAAAAWSCSGGGSP
jgi:hypothetical protein